MQTLRDKDYDRIGIENDKVTLSGAPDLLSGPITLSNKGKEQVWVETLPVSFDKATGLPSKALINAYAIIPAGSKVNVQATLELDPSLAPGNYNGKVLPGKKSTALELLVEPSRSSEFFPDSLTLSAKKAGETIKATVGLLNDGNMPVKLEGDSAEQPLEIDEVLSLLTRAVREQGDEGTMPVLDAFVAALKTKIETGLEISIAEEGKVLQAGESLDLHLTIKTPKDPGNARVIQSILKIDDAELEVFVLMP